jgi:hypothetical protein
MHAVDLDVVDRWLDAGEQTVRSEMLKGGTVQKIAILTGSKQILDALKKDIRGPKFKATLGAAPQTIVKETVVAPNLDFMAAIDGEKLTEYLARVKEEATNRNLPDVVGFVQGIEFHLSQNDFASSAAPEPAPVTAPVSKKAKKYVVPTRNGNLKWAEAFSLMNSPAAPKYDAIMAAFWHGPVTDDELRDRLRDAGRGMVPGTVTAYRGDLARAGWVRWTGERRTGASGSSMKVWELAP